MITPEIAHLQKKGFQENHILENTANQNVNNIKNYSIFVSWKHSKFSPVIMINSSKIAAKGEFKEVPKIKNGKLTVATALQSLSIYVIWQGLLLSHRHPDRLHTVGV